MVSIGTFELTPSGWRGLSAPLPFMAFLRAASCCSAGRLGSTGGDTPPAADADTPTGTRAPPIGAPGGGAVPPPGAPGLQAKVVDVGHVRGIVVQA
jgi:hypothetical protein